MEIQKADGSAVPGFGIDDCDVLFGDTIDRVVMWKGNADVSSLAGQPLRLRFTLHDADLYSFQFSDN